MDDSSEAKDFLTGLSPDKGQAEEVKP